MLRSPTKRQALCSRPQHGVGALLCSLFSVLSSLFPVRCLPFAPLTPVDLPRSRRLRFGQARRVEMAKLALIYGMRLLPEEDLSEVRDATVMLKNGKSARVTMHLIEGSKEEIEKTFHQSIEAFFDMYPEI